MGERAERPDPDVQHAARKALRRKTAARGFEQRRTGLQRERKGAAARGYPLDAFGGARAGLNDASHQLVLVRSSSPRASSSSRTSRFGILPYPAFGNPAPKKNRFGIL